MKRVLITRPRLQADGFAAGLKSAGYEPVFYPVVEIQPMQDTTVLDRALQKLGCYDWLVFTSVNGVKAVWDRLEFLGIQQIPGTVRVAAIGPKTADALRERHIQPDFVPAEYVAEAILPGLGDLKGRWVLLPRAEMARRALPEAIQAAGGVAHEIPIYRTVPAPADPAGMQVLLDGIDIVTLTSPSIVRSFVDGVRQAGLDPLNLPGNPLIACIGPITSRAAREEGFQNLLTAEAYTTEGIIQALTRVAHP